MRGRALILPIALTCACIGEPTVVGPGPPDVADLGDRDARGTDAGELTDVRARDMGDADAADGGSSPAGPRFVDVTFARSAACAVENTGRLLCWGRNEARLLGDGADGDLHPPFWRGADFEFTALDAGERHICGIRDGRVYCWGDNRTGAADPAAAGPAFDLPREVRFAGLTTADAVDVSAGTDTSCAAFADGAVACWGANDFGQVDPDNPSPAPLAPTLIAVDAAREVVVGPRHACARLEQGELHCWGDNGAEQAIPGAGPGPLPPTRHGLFRFESVDASEFTCGTIAGRVRCWGENVAARLGTADLDTTLVEAVPNVADVERLGVGVNHACALSPRGRVTCWGEWMSGVAEAPREFSSSDGRAFLRVAAGPRVSCATTLREVLCWGTNRTDGLAGQFENATPVDGDIAAPTGVPLPP